MEKVRTQAKKILSSLLAVLMLALPQSAAFAAGTASDFKASSAAVTPGEISILNLNSESKLHQLTVYIACSGKVSGAEIYRSSNGKKGTYQKIALVKNTDTGPFADSWSEMSYYDKGLKNSKQYFYKARPYLKANGKTYYGSFVSADGFTTLTKSYVSKKLQKAYSVAKHWMDFEIWERDESAKLIKKGNYDYVPIKKDQFTTKRALKAYLCKYFDQDIVNEVVKKYYLEQNGRLYLQATEWGDAASMDYSSSKVIHVSQHNSYQFKTADIVILERWRSPYGDDYEPRILHLILQNGRWVFTNSYDDNDWGYSFYGYTDEDLAKLLSEYA